MAAAQGEADAQANLGVMYFNGEGGLEQNKVTGYALTLLAAPRSKTAEKNQEALPTKMSADEIKMAESLVRELAQPGKLLQVLDRNTGTPKPNLFAKKGLAQ